MLLSFYEVNTFMRILLVNLSQMTLITILASLLMSYRRFGTPKQLAVPFVLFLLNAVLGIFMLLDYWSALSDGSVFLRIPYGLPLVFTAISLVYSLRVLYNTFGQRIGINNTSVKEAFDNLPTGVCFFNTSGLPVLCNLAMYRFSFAVSGKDVQYITDLEECLAEDFVPMDGVKRDGKAFILPDGRVFQIERRELSQINEEDYVQFIVSDITELYGTRCELTEENSQLRKVQQELKRLSANVVTITREEEILNTKMRVHDEMGRCLVAAQKHLRDDASGEGVGEELVTAWQRAVSMLKYNNEANDDDMMSQIRQTCEYINLRLIETGELTSSEDVAYVLACAVRECMTNAVRYAGADELYADFSETDQDATVVLTNNGKVPDGDIVEGGGLSTLRKRVERSGGVMTVSAAPRFKLTVTVPKNKEMLS